MTKKEKVQLEIVKVEKDLERLKKLLSTVNGNALEMCPYCNTLNRHWYPKDYWCCANC